MADVTIDLPNNWKPRQHQKALWSKLMSGCKRSVARWHRRAGKDDVYLNYTCLAAHERIGNYWYMLPEYSQARKSMWDAVNPNTGQKRLDTIIPEILRAKTNQQEMKIELHCGSIFQLVGSDNFNSLVGSPPVGLVFSEYAISNPSSWAYLMPILEENGGWAAFNSTPRGKNHFHKLCLMAEDDPSWYYDTQTVDTTGIFKPEQLARIKNELIQQHGEEFGTAIFLQEYYVSFEAAIMGAIWADCLFKLQYANRIGYFPHDPNYPVHTAFDLGSTDTTAIWFYQVKGSELYIINCHESNHKDIPFYDNLLRELPYSYASIWLPHDAFASHLAAGGKTIAQQFIDLNKDGRLGSIKKVPNVSKQQGIQAARATFPRCYIHEEATGDGLEALRSYHHGYDEEKKIFTDQPVHDWASNYADAFRYLSLTWKEARNIKPVINHLVANSINNITMGALTKKHLDRMKARRNGED